MEDRRRRTILTPAASTAPAQPVQPGGHILGRKSWLPSKFFPSGLLTALGSCDLCPYSGVLQDVGHPGLGVTCYVGGSGSGRQEVREAGPVGTLTALIHLPELLSGLPFQQGGWAGPGPSVAAAP